LERSWQKWQNKYGKVLNEEKQRIFSRISSSPAQETTGKDVADAKRNYFAYRMAIAQLALYDNIEVPLIFSVGEMNEEQSFCEEITGYLLKLSISRQVVFHTSNAKLCKKLTETGWQMLNTYTERLESK
jgi:exonuclease SbcC